MSSGIYPAFEGDWVGAPTSAWSGRALSRNDEALAAAASALGVASLSSFIDNRSMLEMLLDEEEVSAIDCPETAWFDTKEGLRTIQALRDYVQSCTDWPHLTEIVEDLTELEQALTIAAQSDVRFHLLVDV